MYDGLEEVVGKELDSDLCAPLKVKRLSYSGGPLWFAPLVHRCARAAFGAVYLRVCIPSADDNPLFDVDEFVQHVVMRGDFVPRGSIWLPIGLLARAAQTYGYHVFDPRVVSGSGPKTFPDLATVLDRFVTADDDDDEPAMSVHSDCFPVPAVFNDPLYTVLDIPIMQGVILSDVLPEFAFKFAREVDLQSAGVHVFTGVHQACVNVKPALSRSLDPFFLLQRTRVVMMPGNNKLSVYVNGLSSKNDVVLFLNIDDSAAGQLVPASALDWVPPVLESAFVQSHPLDFTVVSHRASGVLWKATLPRSVVSCYSPICVVVDKSDSWYAIDIVVMTELPGMIAEY